MNLQLLIIPIIIFSTASQGLAGPLLEAVKENTFQGTKSILGRDEPSFDEICEALDWANHGASNDPGRDPRITILLTVAKSLKPFEKEGKASGPPALAPSGPVETKEVAASSSSSSADNAGPVHPGVHVFKVGDEIIASSGRVAKVIKVDHRRVDSQWVEEGRLVTEFRTGMTNIRPLRRITRELGFDQGAGRFYLFAEDEIDLETRRLALYKWRRASKDPGDLEPYKARQAHDCLIRGLRQRTADAYLTEVTALLPERARWLLSQDKADHPSVNCYGTVLFYYNAMPVLKYVDEKEFLFLAASPLSRSLGRTFSDNRRPPIGSIGILKDSHAFIYIGADLVFHKPDPYTPWEIQDIKALPYCKRRPFEAAHFIACNSIDDYLKTVGAEDSEEVRNYRHWDGELQLLEELAMNYEKGKTPPKDFPDHGASFYTPLNTFVDEIAAQAQAKLRLAKAEPSEENKGASSSSAAPRSDEPAAFLWSSLLNRLKTLKERPLFKPLPH